MIRGPKDGADRGHRPLPISPDTPRAEQRPTRPCGGRIALDAAHRRLGSNADSSGITPRRTRGGAAALPHSTSHSGCGSTVRPPSTGWMTGARTEGNGTAIRGPVTRAIRPSRAGAEGHGGAGVARAHQGLGPPSFTARATDSEYGRGESFSCSGPRSGGSLSCDNFGRLEHRDRVGQRDTHQAAAG